MIDIIYHKCKCGRYMRMYIYACNGECVCVLGLTPECMQRQQSNFADVDVNMNVDDGLEVFVGMIATAGCTTWGWDVMPT